MARQNTVRDEDLPDPQPRPVASLAELAERRWALLRSIVFFCVAYATLHKLVVPLTLRVLKVGIPAYGEIDFTFLIGWSLAFVLLRPKPWPGLMSFLCGALIVAGAASVLELVTSRSIGWLGISHLISAVPLAIAAIAVLSIRSDREEIIAWTGAMFTALLWLSFQSGPDPIAAPAVLQLSPPKAEPSASVDCGAQSLDVETTDPHIPKTHELKIRACGLSPSALRLPKGRDRITIVNETSVAANIHVWKGWNLLVPQGARVESPKLRIRERPDLIYSDSNPGAGLTALIPSEAESMGGRWVLRRLPPAVEKSRP